MTIARSGDHRANRFEILSFTTASIDQKSMYKIDLS